MRFRRDGSRGPGGAHLSERRTILVATGPDEPAGPYVAALIAAGAEPDRIRVVLPEQHDVPRLFADAAGVLFCGGVDVEPRRYGESELPGAGVHADSTRDAFEWDLLAAARSARAPVFGICRGLQVLNVFLGGSLYQDLTLQKPGAVAHSIEPQEMLAHGVFAERGAHPLADLLGREPCVVNSSHHQAVRDLAPGLSTIAVSPDDLIEALALPDGDAWWAQAVQWHPENLLELPLQRELWRGFLTATNGSTKA